MLEVTHRLDHPLFQEYLEHVVGDLSGHPLTDGEQVVIDGQSRLTPGARVTIIRPGADTSRSRQLVRGKGYGTSTAVQTVTP